MTSYDFSEAIERAQNGDRNALDSVVTSNLGLVKAIAKRFIGRGTEYEDLVQIGSIGLMKAVRNFDVLAGTRFSTYAFPLITGEIKKHLRDDGTIKVSRVLKHDASVVNRIRQEYIKENGEEPPLSVITEKSGLDAAEVARAIEASTPVLSFSYQNDEGDRTVEDMVGSDNIGELCEKISLRQSLMLLEKTEREIVVDRYFLGLSQKETGERLGLTQVMVSRKEKKILEKLRDELT